MTDIVERARIAFMGQRPEDVSAELAERLKSLVYEYAGRMTVASAIGTLRIVEREILDDQ